MRKSSPALGLLVTFKASACVYVLALLTACAVPAVTPVVFTALESYERPGWLDSGLTGTLEGSAFLRQRNGVVQSCAGSGVSLIPRTNYADERMGFIYGNLEGGLWVRDISSTGSSKMEAGYSEDTKETVCDVEGRFSFSEVPSGEWYVVTQVVWETPGRVTQGGPVMRRVQVKENENTTVVVTQ